MRALGMLITVSILSLGDEQRLGNMSPPTSSLVEDKIEKDGIQGYRKDPFAL